MSDREIHSLQQEQANGLLHGVDATFGYVQSLAPAATATTTLDAVSAYELRPTTTLFVAPTAGGGAFSHIVVLPVANRAPGDIIDVLYTQPASTNPTVVFRNASASGTVLLTVSGAVSKVANASFRFNGTAWKLINARQTTEVPAAAVVLA